MRTGERLFVRERVGRKVGIKKIQRMITWEIGKLGKYGIEKH